MGGFVTVAQLSYNSHTTNCGCMTLWSRGSIYVATRSRALIFIYLLFGRKEKIATNRTHSFLLVTEKDIGDPLMLKFKWEETNSWSASSMLKMVSSWWSGDSDNGNMEVHKIRIRAGETQQK